jgi:type III secretory pathway component EscR
MTNKMRLIFVIATTVCALFVVLSTPFAVDVADRILSVIANALGLHEAPTPSALAILIIPGLYLAFRQKRHQ